MELCRGRGLLICQHGIRGQCVATELQVPEVAGNRPPRKKTPLRMRRAERFPPTQVGNGGDHGVVQKQNVGAAQRGVGGVEKAVVSHQLVMVSSQRWRCHPENRPGCTSHFFWWPWQHLHTFMDLFSFLFFFFPLQLIPS